jgi:hypothetical protein
MQKIVTDFPIIFPTYIPTSTTGYVAQKPGAYLLAKGDALSNEGSSAFTATDTAAGLSLTVAGTINNSNFGIYLDNAAVGDHVHVASSGVVDGDGYGINVAGSNNTILNDGVVHATDTAISIGGIGQKIVNNGSLEGEKYVCVEASGDGNVIQNHGTIDGVIGIGSDVQSGETLKFFNDGSVSASGIFHYA